MSVMDSWWQERKIQFLSPRDYISRRRDHGEHYYRLVTKWMRRKGLMKGLGFKLGFDVWVRFPPFYLFFLLRILNRKMGSFNNIFSSNYSDFSSLQLAVTSDLRTSGECRSNSSSQGWSKELLVPYKEFCILL